MDSYGPDLSLVVEVDERQHDHPVTHFDKPDRITVSGVHRGEQRRIYDQRRRSLIPAHNLTLLIVRTSQLAVDARGKLLRDVHADDLTLRALLDDALAGPGHVHEMTPACPRRPRTLGARTRIADLGFSRKFSRPLSQ